MLSVSKEELACVFIIVFIIIYVHLFIIVFIIIYVFCIYNYLSVFIKDVIITACSKHATGSDIRQ